MNILIKDAIILPMSDSVYQAMGKRYFRGSVGIFGNKIAFVVGEHEAAQKEMQFKAACLGDVYEIDGRGKLVMPGLINIHNHVAMTLMRSFADDMPLMKWLNDHIWPFEAKLTGDDIRLGAELGMAEMLLGGTTTFVDMYWNEVDVAEAVKKSGIRAVLSPTFTDARFADFEKDFDLMIGSYSNWECHRISLMIAPHSVYSCSREHLLYAKELAEKYGLMLNIHVSETLDEQQTMRERVGKTPIEYLDELGMLTERTLVVHAVHVSDSDIEIMRKRGVSIAHNPHSNMKISSGVAPVVKMVEAGLNVGIGTDGPSSNNDLDMWEELRTASFLQKSATMDPLVMPAYQALEMATVNGAKAIGLDGYLGKLEKGMIADLIVLDVEKPHMYPQHDMIANLVYAAKSSDVETVIVGGDIVVRNGKTVNIDSVELCHAVQQRVEQILKR